MTTQEPGGNWSESVFSLAFHALTTGRRELICGNARLTGAPVMRKTEQTEGSLKLYS